MPAALPELQRRFPKLNLQLRETITETLVHELVSGTLDLILIALPVENPELETLHLFDDKFILAVKATRENKRVRNATPSMLAQSRLLLLEEGHCLRDQALSFCRMVTPEARDSFGASSLATIVQMVANGYGITLLPEMAIGSEVHHRQRYSSVALRRTGAEARDRACLAQDLSAQGRLHPVRAAAQGRGTVVW